MWTKIVNKEYFKKTTLIPDDYGIDLLTRNYVL